MTGVLTERRNLDAAMHTERALCEGEGSAQVDTAEAKEFQ